MRMIIPGWCETGNNKTDEEPSMMEELAFFHPENFSSFHISYFVCLLLKSYQLEKSLEKEKNANANASS